MKKDQPNSPSERSFTAAFEQMAKLLRSEVKMKERSAKVIPPSSLPPSFRNSLDQIAKLLRKEIQPSKPPKKRSWKNKDSIKNKTN